MLSRCGMSGWQGLRGGVMRLRLRWVVGVRVQRFDVVVDIWAPIGGKGRES